ncbi:MAG TPA: hypothetical protein VGB78_04815 [Thermoplasmata archaeon]
MDSSEGRGYAALGGYDGFRHVIEELPLCGMMRRRPFQTESVTPFTRATRPSSILLLAWLASLLQLLGTASIGISTGLELPSNDNIAEITSDVIVLDTENSPPSVSVPDEPSVYHGVSYMFSSYCTDSDLNDSIRLTWSWGDGGTSVTDHQSTGGAFTATCSHTYIFRGEYNLTVWIDDLTGLPGHNNSDWGFVHVNGSGHVPIIVSFDVDNEAPSTGKVVTFWATAIDYDSDICVLTFDFGDGTTSDTVQTEPNSTVYAGHAYEDLGYYLAFVTAFDGQWSDTMGPIDLIVNRASFDLNLVAGWNMVTVPLVNTWYMANNLSLAPMDVVCAWDPLSQTYDRNYYVGASPPGSNFPIEEGEGYWIYSGTAKTLTLEGDLPTGEQSYYIGVPASGGWALVGLTSLKTTWNASDIPMMYSVAGGIRVVASWDPRMQTYESYYPGVPTTDFRLVPGWAFWCWCTASGTLSYDP